MDVAWTKFLRRASQAPSAPLRCPLCAQDIAESSGGNTTTITAAPNAPNVHIVPAVLSGFSLFEKHVGDAHARELGEKASSETRNSWLLSLWKTAERNARQGGAAADGPGPGSNGTLPRHPPCDRSAADAQPSQIPEGTGSRPEVGTPGSPIPSVNSLKRAEGSGGDANPGSPSKRVRAQPSPSPSPSPPPPPPIANPNDARADFERVDRGHVHRGRLWTPDDDATPAQPQSRDRPTTAPGNNNRGRGWANKRPGRQNQTVQQRQLANDHEDTRPIKMMKEPDTRPISQDQLVAEVKGIYAGLVVVENKCIEVDNAQSKGGESSRSLNNSQWQALVTLHRTLLNEHHDFFLASQHPSASPALQKLAAKYSMPARMWRHGIHSFLELLRHRLPESLEHMLLFIYVAYAMMALLYETVHAFEDTWVECLGDLARYRMAIEDDDVRDRENWTSVSRGWYSKASDKAPTIGRLYHHLAILSRPHALKQQFNYAKSLCVSVPFASTRESILTLYEPVLAVDAKTKSKFEPSDFAFTRCHAILFTGKDLDKFEATVDEFVALVGNDLSRRPWQEAGYYIGITLCCSIAGYGSNFCDIFRTINSASAEAGSKHQSPKTSSAPTPAPAPAEKSVNGAAKSAAAEHGQEQAMDDVNDSVRLAAEFRSRALAFARKTHEVVLRRPEEACMVPYLHVTLVFMLHLVRFPSAIADVAPEFPWKLVATRLNRFMANAPLLAQASFNKSFLSVVEGDEFPHVPEKENVLPVPLPEDYALRGLVWDQDYFPANWFSNEGIEDDERLFEPPSLEGVRKERAIWVGRRIAMEGQGKWLTYDQEAHRFGVAPEWELEVGDLPPAVPTGSTAGSTGGAATATATTTATATATTTTAASTADATMDAAASAGASSGTDLGTLPDARVEPT